MYLKKKNTLQFVLFGGDELLLGVLILNLIIIEPCLAIWIFKLTIQKTASGLEE